MFVNEHLYVAEQEPLSRAATPTQRFTFSPKKPLNDEVVIELPQFTSLMCAVKPADVIVKHSFTVPDAICVQKNLISVAVRIIV